MIWFDHSVWFMLNNLDRFFDARYPTLATKFGAFITWISAASLLAVKAQITFIAFRRLMEVAALELAAHPNDKLLAKYLDTPRARQVERFFKPATFSLETTPSPSPTSASRRRRLNMNVIPEATQQHPQSNNASQRTRPYKQHQHQASGGRGRYNKNFRLGQRTAFRFIPEEQLPASSNQPSQTCQDTTPPSISGSSVSIRPWSPMKARVLAWEDA